MPTIPQQLAQLVALARLYPDDADDCHHRIDKLLDELEREEMLWHSCTSR